MNGPLRPDGFALAHFRHFRLSASFPQTVEFSLKMEYYSEKAKMQNFLNTPRQTAHDRRIVHGAGGRPFQEIRRCSKLIRFRFPRRSMQV
ncbi:hypothetical protein [Paraburkholderia susongensis]|uniref:hypothetical protein n=1 Tax=Paraburkholderia susongensis TaxID=1515439 RepID=UPI00142E085B|nr:hypothetical protein [Paraburkholderia susongensis]